MFCFFIYGALTMTTANKIPITLSSTDVNRLSLKNGRIKHIFGVDLFEIEKDEDNGQIFLHVKENATLPDSISMAFVTDNGVTQDLLVSFQDGISTPIVFTAPKSKESKRRMAKQFFYDVLSGKTDPYIRQDEGGSQEFEWGRMQFKTRFLSQNFIVEIFDVYGKKPCCIYYLRHNLFIQPRVCGVYLSSKVLKGKKPIRLLLLKQR